MMRLLYSIRLQHTGVDRMLCRAGLHRVVPLFAGPRSVLRCLCCGAVGD
jgi:hypothetical protein